jgi:hypothetical protein
VATSRSGGTTGEASLVAFANKCACLMTWSLASGGTAPKFSIRPRPKAQIEQPLTLGPRQRRHAFRRQSGLWDLYPPRSSLIPLWSYVVMGPCTSTTIPRDRWPHTSRSSGIAMDTGWSIAHYECCRMQDFSYLSASRTPLWEGLDVRIGRWAGAHRRWSSEFERIAAYSIRPRCNRQWVCSFGRGVRAPSLTRRPTRFITKVCRSI